MVKLKQMLKPKLTYLLYLELQTKLKEISKKAFTKKKKS